MCEEVGAIDFNKIVKGTIYNIEKVVFRPISQIGIPINHHTTKFNFFTSESIHKPSTIDYYKPDILTKCEGKIFFIIHGLLDGSNSPWIHNMIKILLNKNDASCAVTIDWSLTTGTINYPFVVSQTDKFGVFVGEFINRMLTKYEVPEEKIALIGHSLGAQAVGVIAKTIKKMSGILLPFILGLDPAGPNFNVRPVSKRLNKEDAEVVMIIHSDKGKFGISTECGTIDFYPNGGNNQPGCSKITKDTIVHTFGPLGCNHARSLDYIVEAVNNTGSFPARRCRSYSHYIRNKCDSNKLVYMGDLETKERGSFYLITNSESPFSIPEDDI
ncbi:phospholipase A1 2-like isoform X2 [Harmonia axyridis]|uniref:phospholipase A1 2-like isoform X2 n=1 Tax=Harmonia axyridis TaxID=115357 RepID=UPI001E276912|nr:phospholipase A1 2-like isoform X2 [Harmonia axyridis]